MFFRILAILVLGAVLYGCASISKAQCELGDWYGVGKADGFNGYSSTGRLASHAEACAKQGISINHGQYQAGYDEGLRGYCTMPRGLREGQANKSYAGVCSGEADFEFRRGYDVGKEYYSVKSRITRLNQKIRRATKEQSKYQPDSPDSLRIAGDIKADQREVNILSVDLGRVEQRVSNLLQEHQRYQGGY